MLRHSKVFHKVAKLLDSVLPIKLYLWIFPKLLRIVNPRRAHVDVRFKHLSDGLISADTGHDNKIFFYEKSRLELYCWKDGINKRIFEIRKKYEFEEIKVARGDIVADVGANIGEFSLSVCDLAKVVYAFEPEPLAHTCLERNVHGKNITAIRKAASNKSGALTFYVAPKTADSSVIEPLVPYECVSVEAVSLDSFFHERGLNVSFLKIEAEGYEPEVLMGASQLLATSVNKVAVDAGPERRGENTVKWVSSILEKNNFLVFVRNNMVFGLKR